MVKKGFPPISLPLEVYYPQGGNSNDLNIPQNSNPQETTTFEKPSVSYGWFHKLWTKLISVKWAGNLRAITTNESSTPDEFHSGPALAPIQRLSSRTGSDRPSSPVSSDEATRLVVNNFLKRFVRDEILGATNLDEIFSWITDSAVDSYSLQEAIDCALFKINAPAWETLAYLSGEECKIEKVRKIYLEGQSSIRMLGSSLLGCEIQDRMFLALWRIWAYCILSVDSMVAGECIAIQEAWLRGPEVGRVMLGRAQLDGGTNGNWRLYRKNGIFAQSNKDIRQDDIDEMIKVWDLLRQKWSEVMTGNVSNEQAADQHLMHVFSRVSGPKDVLNILTGPRHPSFSFHEAFRLTPKRSRVNYPSRAQVNTIG